MSITSLFCQVISPIDKWRLKQLNKKMEGIHKDFAALEQQREKRITRSQGCGMSKHDGEQLLSLEEIKTQKEELSGKFRKVSDVRARIVQRQRSAAQVPLGPFTKVTA